MKIRRVGAEFVSWGPADVTQLIVTFRDFANAAFENLSVDGV